MIKNDFLKKFLPGNMFANYKTILSDWKKHPERYPEIKGSNPLKLRTMALASVLFCGLQEGIEDAVREQGFDLEKLKNCATLHTLKVASDILTGIYQDWDSCLSVLMHIPIEFDNTPYNVFANPSDQ